MTTPHKLPYLNVIRSLRILLTPTERRRPWILYLTPGLVAVKFAHVAYVVLFLNQIQRLLLPQLMTITPDMPIDKSTHVKLAIFLVIALLSRAILTPLEVIAIRLSIQKNHAAPEFNTISQENSNGGEVTEYAGVDEDVIGYVH
jgi:hypothetical protein